MTTLLVLLVAIFVVHTVSPKLGSALAWLITIGFLVPFMTLAGGTLGWVMINFLTFFSCWSLAAWLWCCVAFGLPLAAVIGWFVLTD